MGEQLGRRVLMVALAIVVALAVGLVPPSSKPAAAQDWQEWRDVTAWVQVSSTAPGVGCEVTTSIEVRDSWSGGAVGGVGVVASLYVDGWVAAEDWAVTGGDGVAWLGVDTWAAYAGAAGWLSISIGDSYAGGMVISPTAYGGCADAGALQTMWTSIPAASVGSPGGGAGWDDSWSATGSGGGTWFWVPSYVQQRNLSCEYASLTIATGTFGYAVSEYEFDGRVGWSANPHWGYRGNINGWWGNTWDYGVYAEPLVAPLAEFGFYGEVFYGGGDAGALINRLDRGMPTLVWIGLWGNTAYYDWAEGGGFKLAAGYHVVVAHGYDANGVYVSDPASGSYNYYDWGTFLSMWSVLDGMSLAVAPY